MHFNINEQVKFGSYNSEDVIFLLKNLNGIILEGSTEEREKRFKVEHIIAKHYQSNIIHQNSIYSFFGRHCMIIKIR